MKAKKKLTPKQVRKLWADTLRSGDYKQGKELLHYKDRDGKHYYCCLGVLCELAVKHGVVELDTPQDHLAYQEYSYDGNDRVLPGQVVDWAGLVNEEGSFEPKGVRLQEKHIMSDGSSSLAHINDHGKKFAGIATIIESEPEGMFHEETK